MSTMTSAEKAVLHDYFNQSNHYLEFGAGESTIDASGIDSLQTVTSVESSAIFIEEKLKTNATIAKALIAGKLAFHLVDIGETGTWGYPINHAKQHLWPNYPLSVFSQKSKHDLILVDGRFRVACTLSCVMNAPKNCTLLIHDFWNRPEYHVVLPFLQIKDKVDTLGVFKPIDRINVTKIQLLIKKYQYLPGDKTWLWQFKENLNFYFPKGFAKK